MLSQTEPAKTAVKQSTLFARNILVFHKLTNKVTFGPTNNSPARFAILIEKLIESGYNFVSLNQAIQEGQPKQLAITFDDGYSHLMQALPAFIENFSLRPTVFIPTAYIGRKNSWDYSSLIISERHLDKAEMAELASMGVEFASHGHHHIDLTGCDSKTIEDELVRSKETIEDITDQRVNAISYPFGRFNLGVTAQAKNAGYKYAFTMKFPSFADGQYVLGRIPIYFFDSPLTVNQKLNGTRMRTFHKNVCGAINSLSNGTVLFNKILGRQEI